MSVDRTEGRRANHRAFRPALDSRLEARNLLSTGTTPRVPGPVFVANPSLGFAFRQNKPPFTTAHTPEFNPRNPLTIHAGEQTAHGGQTAVIYQNGGVWAVTLTTYVPAISAGGPASQGTGGTGTALYSGPVQTPGTVRAYHLPGGKWGIIVDGSTSETELDINPVPFPQKKGFAHSFAYAYAARPRVLDIGSLDVTSGQIGAIQGFHTADLSGPLTINGNGTVDRIALNSIQPGGSIYTGGTVNTLDVFNGINLSGGPSVNIGRNLNLLNVGQDLTLSNGSYFFVGETLGALPQPPKGTGTGSNVLTLNQALLGTTTTQTFPNVAAFIQGNLNIDPGSTFTVVNGLGLNTVFAVSGSINGASRLVMPNEQFSRQSNPGTILFNGSITP